MSMIELAKKYLGDIEIEYSDLDPRDDTDYDPACLVLSIPRKMLTEYSMKKTGRRNYPNATEFWKETDMERVLRDSGKQSHNDTPLGDILDYLDGNIEAEFLRSKDKKKIELEVNELTH